jgi:hypothetical protein
MDSELDDSEDASEDSVMVVERDFLERIVATHIENYFKDKVVPGDINLVSPRYVNLCIEMDTCRAVDMAYEAISRHGLVAPDSDKSPIEADIRLVIGILRRMKPLVPQQFSAGMLLMHLEIMEGLTF